MPPIRSQEDPLAHRVSGTGEGITMPLYHAGLCETRDQPDSPKTTVGENENSGIKSVTKIYNTSEKLGGDHYDKVPIGKLPVQIYSTKIIMGKFPNIQQTFEAIVQEMAQGPKKGTLMDSTRKPRAAFYNQKFSELRSKDYLLVYGLWSIRTMVTSSTLGIDYRTYRLGNQQW